MSNQDMKNEEFFRQLKQSIADYLKENGLNLKRRT